MIYEMIFMSSYNKNPYFTVISYLYFFKFLLCNNISISCLGRKEQETWNVFFILEFSTVSSSAMCSRMSSFLLIENFKKICWFPFSFTCHMPQISKCRRLCFVKRVLCQHLRCMRQSDD